LDPCRLLKKAGENLQQTDERPCFGLQSERRGSGVFLVSEQNTMPVHLLVFESAALGMRKTLQLLSPQMGT